MIDLSDCFERKLLTSANPSRGLAKKSLKQAALFLADAEDLIKIEKERMATIALYDAFFHTARALLFFLDYLDTLRDARHETQYSLEILKVEIDLDAGAGICREFMKAVEGLIV